MEELLSDGGAKLGLLSDRLHELLDVFHFDLPYPMDCPSDSSAKPSAGPPDQSAPVARGAAGAKTGPAAAPTVTGSRVWPDKSRYSGQLRAAGGLPHGPGRFWFGDGQRCIDGEWVDGCPVGVCAAVDDSGRLLRMVLRPGEAEPGRPGPGPGRAWREADMIHVGNIASAQGKGGKEAEQSKRGWPGRAEADEPEGSDEWSVEVTWLGGGCWSGRLCGLRPLVDGSGRTQLKLLTETRPGSSRGSSGAGVMGAERS